MSWLSRWWHRAFLEEQPSISLCVFRVAVAITVGCHLIPSLLQLDDNYLSTAFKEKNGSFFPLWALQLVEQSPDWFVRAMVGVFAASWASFFVGFRSQFSAIIMTVACYYFYAMNSLHIGTLSFDILLVTLSLMWATGYHGDWLSVESVLRGDPTAYRRLRPFFIQRLLQLQIAWTFLYTALSKITSQGNWLTDNPYYYLMRYPAGGVVREFPGRAWLAQHPEMCRGIGMVTPFFEILLPFLWFIPQTRVVGIMLGFGFHVMLLVTLHVPTIFFFLFPAQILLFIDPEQVVEPIDARRAWWAIHGRVKLLYDGRCDFCINSVKRLLVCDLLGRVEPIDFHTVPDLPALHPALTPERCHNRIQLLEPGGRLTEGFFSIRRLSLKLPMLWPIALLCYVPGAGWLGQRVYDWVARRRFGWHAGARCRTNQCGVNEDYGD